jgi:N-acetylglucosamine-6-phosphate deacetylase
MNCDLLQVWAFRRGSSWGGHLFWLPLLRRSGMHRLSGHILTPGGFVAGEITFDHGRISGVVGHPVPTDAVRTAGQPIVLPGFVDLHVHGAGGRDVMEGGDAVRRITEVHAEHGTTSLLATTMTAPGADLDVAFSGLAELEAGGNQPRGARILGVHLEGPYINPDQLGAQPSFARPLDRAELDRLSAIVPIRLLTLAPEVQGHLEAIGGLRAAGYVVQIGHSLATFEEGVRAMTEGASGFTHLFNAMSGMHHRKPGLVGAALAHAEYAEIIVDLLHVHPGAVKAALRAIPRLYCVTDSTSATGMPDGQYRLGRQAVEKCMGGVRLADGTLAGSTLTMDQALRNLVDAIGIDLAEASRRVSTYAADHLAISDRGRLQSGAWADLVVLDRDLKLTDVFTEGVSIAHATTIDRSKQSA